MASARSMPHLYSLSCVEQCRLRGHFICPKSNLALHDAFVRRLTSRISPV